MPQEKLSSFFLKNAPKTQKDCSIPDKKCPKMDIFGFFFHRKSLKKIMVQFLLITQT
jgi:hypothetical protein